MAFKPKPNSEEGPSIDEYCYLDPEGNGTLRSVLCAKFCVFFLGVWVELRAFAGIFFVVFSWFLRISVCFFVCLP